MGWMDGWMDGWDGWMDGWDGMDGWMDGWDGWMVWMDEMNGWMDGMEAGARGPRQRRGGGAPLTRRISFTTWACCRGRDTGLPHPTPR